jgi:hypothetical protein
MPKRRCASKISPKKKISTQKKKEKKSQITPTQGESVFESYLSVLIHLLGTQEIYKNIVKETSNSVTIQEVTGRNSIPILKKNTFDPIIYYYKSKNTNDDGGETHYRVYSYEEIKNSRRENTHKWKIIDPYDLYQKKNSHGFCQMFALYIATNNTIDFKDKTEFTKEDLKFVHTYNTFVCLQKTINLIESSSESTINIMNIEFGDLEKNPDYGIPHNMRLVDFVDDLKKFKLTDMDDYIESLK